MVTTTDIQEQLNEAQAALREWAVANPTVSAPQEMRDEYARLSARLHWTETEGKRNDIH